jgi:hypothetical protein
MSHGEGDIVAPSSMRPWVQLGLGLLVMMAMSSPQYVWTLFTKHFQAATDADLSTVQVTFSLLIRRLLPKHWSRKKGRHRARCCAAGSSG